MKSFSSSRSFLRVVKKLSTVEIGKYFSLEYSKKLVTTVFFTNYWRETRGPIACRGRG